MHIKSYFIGHKVRQTTAESDCSVIAAISSAVAIAAMEEEEAAMAAPTTTIHRI